ncbi:GNAT family N-acetyltransferase [Arsenicicoccus sp. oral taxon 190]|uniref:GNAT family N-acetyltransferase n=1 Tax=Arsenicicoccus sp. oral taxon 190 TaxID=1658671 RepID=UPI00067A31CB|nr:GNAT family N-acetyltransferase [Arsenicicoccus sp. oral taxon 190]AKT51569.1 hypothetical protein ADJ73_10145 [Arsenicicoccus sp. oral taxon 190]
MSTVCRLHPRRDPADLDVLVELRAAWAADRGREGDLAELRRQIIDWLTAEGESRRIWAASDDDEPVGMVSLLVYSRMPDLGRPQGRWGYVAQLYVRPHARRRGVATALMAALTEHARDAGLDRLVLHPSEQSVPFYASLGYRPAQELMLLPLL